MALKTEQIDAEAFARWGDMKGGPLEMCRGFARAIEAKARRDALEEAAAAVEAATYRNRWVKAEVNGHPDDVAPCELAETIRDMKEDTQ